MIKLFLLFLRFEGKKFSKYFETRTLAKLITVALFFAVFAFVGAGIYFFFVSGFRYINVQTTADIKDALTLFLYEVFLLVLMLVGSVSALVTAVFSLFRSSSMNWLIATPGYRIFPHIAFTRSFFASLFPSLILFVPTVLALSRSNHLGFFAVITILVSLLILLVLINSLILISIVGISSLCNRISNYFKHLFTFKQLLSVLLVLLCMVSVLTWKAIRSVDLVALFKAEDVSTEVIKSATIAEHFMIFPTHPVAMEILMLQNNHNVQAYYYVLLLTLLTLFTLFVWIKIAPKYYCVWQRFQESSSGGNGNSLEKQRIILGNYTFNHGQMFALFSKESLLFKRNFKGVMWFLFLLFLWVLQIGTNVVLSKNIGRYAPDISDRIAILQALQFMIAVYFMSSFTLRFVFPSFSVEKKTAWILRSAPLGIKKIFLGKYFFFTTFFVTLGLCMSYTSSMVLNVSFERALTSTVLFIVTTLFVVTAGLCLGALFPSQETDDPESVTTSMSGLFFTGFALMYGGLATWVLYQELSAENGVMLISFVFITLSVTVTGIFGTIRMLRKPSL